MNAYELNFDPTALASPKTIDDLIALAKEIRAEFAVIHGHMDKIIDRAQQAEAA